MINSVIAIADDTLEAAKIRMSQAQSGPEISTRSEFGRDKIALFAQHRINIVTILPELPELISNDYDNQCAGKWIYMINSFPISDNPQMCQDFLAQAHQFFEFNH